MDELTNLEERRVESYLAPLQTLRPVSPQALTGRPRTRLRTMALAAAVVAALTIGGVAVARETLTSHATPDRTPVSAGGSLACARLVGMDAERAAALLRSRGEAISWRLTRYVDPARNGGVVGYAEDVGSPPSGTVVEDVAAAAEGGLVVFIRQSADANAPPLAAPRC